MLQQSIKAVNMLVLVLFMACVMYNLCAYSQSPPGARDGALAVVNVDTDDDDGSVSTEDDGEIGNSDAASPKQYEVFYPTKEWQTVRDGQAIPAGLHVRMNLQTGEKEAKLNEDDTGIKFWQTDGHQGMVNTDKKHWSRDELKRALKDFKSNADGGGQDSENAEAVKKKFKSYDELKKNLEEMNMALKTDTEIMVDLIQRFKMSNTDVDKRKIVLEELEYHLHKIDNAQTFCDMGGMPLLISSLNDTSTALQSEAALALGAALQSNPKVQIVAIEHGAMHQLLKTMSTSETFTVKKKALYALSSLARHFPFAQRKFLELGGLSALKRLFEDDDFNSQKLQIKALTLLNDLLVEKDLILRHTKEDNSADMEKLKQYQQVDIRGGMQESGWCELIPKLLAVDDHEGRERVLQAMSTLVSDCRPHFSASVLDLEKLKYEYEALAVGEKLEEGDDYFSGLAELISSMLVSVRNRDEL